jgi:hypothetical protein
LCNFPKFSQILKSIEIRKEILFELWPIFGFQPSRGPPSLSSTPAHRRAGPPGLPLSSIANIWAPPSSSSLGQAGRAPPSSAPPPPVSRAMVRSQPAAPSHLTPLLLADFASPSFSNRRAPPSMVPPSLHRCPVASLPLGTYKRRPGSTSPRRIPHHPPFLLSRTRAHPHHAPSTVAMLPHRPTALSPLTLQ